jgi:hypothetical protein
MTFLLIFGVHLGFTPSDVLLAPAAAPILALSLLLLYQLPLQSPQYSSQDVKYQHPNSHSPPRFSMHYARCDVVQAGRAVVGGHAGVTFKVHKHDNFLAPILNFVHFYS